MKKLISVLVLIALLFSISAFAEDEWFVFAEDPNNLAGEWVDTVSERAALTIFYDGAAEDGNVYSVLISWSSSASATFEWFFTGYYEDIDDGCIVSTDCTKSLITFSEGDELEFDLTVLYENGACRLTLLDGILYWQDNSENAGKDCAFERFESMSFVFEGDGFAEQ